MPPEEKHEISNAEQLMRIALGEDSAALQSGNDSPRDPEVTVWDPPSPYALSEIMDGYLIERILGRGGMGAVYLARQQSLGRLVAIKILPSELEFEPEFEVRFKREAQAMGQLSHANIIQIYDFGQTSAGHYYFVMEYADGADLHQRIQSRSLDTDAALQAISQVCDAMAYAHAKGFIHRDIKPANVFLDSRGLLKVGDFGLAKIVASENGDLQTQSFGLTMTGVALGTPHYIAPEQFESGTVIDHRVDIYSLGVMFYEMVTGDIPRGHFKLPSQKQPGLDARIDRIIQKSLEQEPDDRYQNATEFRNDVTEIITNPLVQSAEKQSPTSPTLSGSLNSSDKKKFSFLFTKKGLSWIIAGSIAWLLLLSALIGTIYSKWNRESQNPPFPSVQESPVPKAPPPNLAAINDTPAIASPDITQETPVTLVQEKNADSKLVMDEVAVAPPATDDPKEVNPKPTTSLFPLPSPERPSLAGKLQILRWDGEAMPANSTTAQHWSETVDLLGKEIVDFRLDLQTEAEKTTFIQNAAFLTKDGKVFRWDDGETSGTSFQNIVQIAITSRHLAALDDGGEVYLLGSDSDRPRRTAIPDTSPVVQISCADGLVFVLCANGRIYSLMDQARLVDPLAKLPPSTMMSFSETGFFFSESGDCFQWNPNSPDPAQRIFSASSPVRTAIARAHTLWWTEENGTASFWKKEKGKTQVADKSLRWIVPSSSNRFLEISPGQWMAWHGSTEQEIARIPEIEKKIQGAYRVSASDTLILAINDPAIENDWEREDKSLLKIEGLEFRLRNYLSERVTRVSTLASGYQNQLQSKTAETQKNNQRDATLAFEAEQARLEALLNEINQPIGNAEVMSAVSLPPQLDAIPATHSDPELQKLRIIWDKEYAAILNELDEKLDLSLSALKTALTKNRQFDAAEKVLTYQKNR